MKTIGNTAYFCILIVKECFDIYSFLGKQTLVKALGVVGAAVLAAVVLL